MRITAARPALIVACALTAASCGGGSMPASPSVLSPLAASAGGTLRPLDDPTPTPAPAPDPAPPAPAPDPPFPPPPTPATVTINIVGTAGSSAFMPNPSAANMGDQIVFSNSDARVHHIVLDGGADLGEVQPGQSSAPTALTTPAATFHCTIHPTMVGAINGAIAAPPYEPPPDDYYGYYTGR
jgi:plastocyanin